MTETSLDQNHTKTLISLCESIKSQRVLVIGDVILDRFVYGSVDRISPESPVPVLALSREETMLGGAGNAFANLKGLGAQCILLSVIGDDVEGRAIAAKIQDMGGDNAALITDSERPTSVKTRFLAGHQQLLRSDFETKAPLSEASTKALLQQFDQVLPDVQAIIVSDYGKGVLSEAVLRVIIDKARAANVPVIVDPKGTDFSIYRGASAITPNKKELSGATQGAAVASDDDIIKAGQQLIERCGIDAVIATRSQDGISVIQAGAEPVHVRSVKNIEVFDVSGAGDTVIATVAAGIAAGGSLADAAMLANIAGSIAVTKVGTAPITYAELTYAIEDGIDAQPSSTARTRQAPLAQAEAALEQVKRWRMRGLRIGFTNGCFDIIHAGHVTYLNEARKHCDRLIVGLNSDSSVRILKGAERPIHDERARATVLGALASVDMVVLFGAEQTGDDNTAIQLLDLLKPDAYFKGGDYKVDDIPETPTVRAYGGDVQVLSVVDGYSTTNAIKKIKQSEAA